MATGATGPVARPEWRMPGVEDAMPHATAPERKIPIVSAFISNVLGGVVIKIRPVYHHDSRNPDSPIIEYFMI